MTDSGTTNDELAALVERVRERVEKNGEAWVPMFVNRDAVSAGASSDIRALCAEVERLTVINIKLRNDWIYENACKEQFRKKAERMTDEVIALTAEVKRLNARVHELSWQGQVDHMSGAFDPNDRHEMGG